MASRWRELGKRWGARLLFVPPVAVGGLVLLVAAGLREPPETEADGETARSVRVIRVEPVRLVPRAVGYGATRPGQVWKAVAQVGGQVVESNPRLKRGALLQKGALLVRIDETAYRIALSRAEAAVARTRAQEEQLDLREANDRASLAIAERSLALAERELERKRRLLEEGTLPQAEVDREEQAMLRQRATVQEIRNRLAMLPAERALLEAGGAEAGASLRDARRQLGYTTIRAPFDCRLAEVNVETGQYVPPGQVLAVADGIATAEVPAQFTVGQIFPLAKSMRSRPTLEELDESAIGEILDLGATVRFRSGEIEATWDGTVTRLRDTLDPQSRTVGVIVQVDRPYARARLGTRPALVKGMYCSVELRGPAQEARLVVPASALHRVRPGDRPGANDRADADTESDASGGTSARATDDGQSYRERRRVLYIADQEDRLERRLVTVAFEQGMVAVIREGLAAGERVVVSDPVPAIDGMLLSATRDETLERRIRAAAEGTGAEP